MSANLVATYPHATATTTRDALATYVCDHVYLQMKLNEEVQKTTPFPKSHFQFWDNLIITEKKDQKKNCDEKVRVQKTEKKDVLDEKTGKTVKKNVKVDGVFEEKEKRLRKIATFNAGGKAKLSFLFVSFIAEAKAALVKGITGTDSSYYRQAIIDGGLDCDYAISPLIFAVNDAFTPEKVAKRFPSTTGNLLRKLEETIDKDITNTGLRNFMVDQFLTFLKHFVVHLSGNLWYELSNPKKTPEEKKAEEDRKKAGILEIEEDGGDDDDDEKTGKGTAVSEKQIQQYIMIQSTQLIMDDNDKPNEMFAEGWKAFSRHLEASDNVRKTLNAAKRKEAKEKKEAETGTAVKAAVAATTDVAPPSGTAAVAPADIPAPAPAAKAPAPAAVPAPAAASGASSSAVPPPDAIAAAPAAAAPTGRRRRGVA